MIFIVKCLSSLTGFLGLLERGRVGVLKLARAERIPLLFYASDLESGLIRDSNGLQDGSYLIEHRSVIEIIHANGEQLVAM